MTDIRKLFREEEGQDAIEYALLAGFISIAIAAGATALGSGIGAFFTDLGTKMGTFKLA